MAVLVDEALKCLKCPIQLFETGKGSVNVEMRKYGVVLLGLLYIVQAPYKEQNRFTA